ncbi:Golgi phosphoprotein 3 (GPP34) [Actinopolyspora xinjiangensis]|uniref:Golgi phosphoprotein 3 (GPP34) n=1 Tax=Actinopolyspora xinjiangensis TaxID=405564 RepID=A0A1H0VTS6_9ACTN|nr:GPP34 family phosphoprotein [Actinopolyspora xinjiangensis]SDP81506.1 Golgi phosphoprotein 3 (GPP34) [Actinopolyspora xinjiangensis]
MEAHLSLSLPDQIVLLLHGPTGRPFVGVNRNVVTPAAEAAELVMHGRAQLSRTAFGTVKIGLLDRTPIGVEALDRPLSTLVGRTGHTPKPISLYSWMTQRRTAFEEHRWSLNGRGYLQYRPDKMLGFIPYDRYLPHNAARQTLIGEFTQLARGERELNDRLALLVAIAYPSGLYRQFVSDRGQSRRLKHIAKGHLLEGAVSAAVAATGAAIAGAVGGGGGDGGGDGGGG